MHGCVMAARCVRTEVDWEVELAVVIGKPAKNVSIDTALSYVRGYTVANDVSARRWQGKAGGSQWCRAKVFDTFCPLGPRLVPAEDIKDPNMLNLSCSVNGEVVQSSNTSDMIFSVRCQALGAEACNQSLHCNVIAHPVLTLLDQLGVVACSVFEQVAEIIAFLSEGTTLLPGTVILTGTPEGVGFTRDPPRYLSPGDTVTVAVEGIGMVVHQMIQRPSPFCSQTMLDTFCSRDRGVDESRGVRRLSL